MTDEETIKHLKTMFAGMLAESAKKDISEDGGDLNTALSALGDRFMNVLFQELFSTPEASQPGNMPRGILEGILTRTRRWRPLRRLIQKACRRRPLNKIVVVPS